jgi:hypothetical protein
MNRKAVLRSVRLDDDVWAAVKAMDESLNQFLRDVLINGIGITDDAEKIGKAMERGEFDKSPEPKPPQPPQSWKRGPRPKGDKSR